MKKIICCLLACVAVLISAAAAFAEIDAEKQLRLDYSDFQFESVAPSPIAGLYEVVAGDQLYYYAPKEGIMLVAQMYDKSKRNLTAERMKDMRDRREKEIVRKAKELPLDSAIKTGSGKNIVIEFTDPDCPYCRKAADYFTKRTDVTRYTFFIPLDMHPDAKNKIRHIFCRKDSSKALEEVMKGKIDQGKYETCSTAQVEQLIGAHKTVAEKMGISGTPFFIVGDTPVSGADFTKLDQALGK